MKLDVVQGGREAWLEHAYTKAQRRKCAERSKVALARLLSVCADSTDPNVLRAYHAYAVNERVLELLGSDERKENDE